MKKGLRKKIIYKNKDVSQLFNCKEDAIIKLYAEKTNNSVMKARKIYYASKLKNVIHNLDNELWLESEYYILDNYGKLMEKCPVPDIIPVVEINTSQRHKTIKGNNSKGRAETIISMYDKMSPKQQRKIEKQMKMLTNIKPVSPGIRKRTSDFKLKKGELKT